MAGWFSGWVVYWLGGLVAVRTQVMVMKNGELLVAVATFP